MFVSASVLVNRTGVPNMPRVAEWPKQHSFKVSPPMRLGFTIDKTRDPDGETLRSVLAAQFAYERMKAARSWFSHLLAVTGVVIWLQAIWPDLVHADIRFFTLTVFGGILFLLFGRQSKKLFRAVDSSVVLPARKELR